MIKHRILDDHDEKLLRAAADHNLSTGSGADANTAYNTEFVLACKKERQRLRGILTHAEARARPLLARSVAFDSDLTMEQAIKLLAAAPKQASGSALASLMAGVENPKIGCDPDDDPGAGKRTIDPDAVYAARRRPIDKAN